MPSSRPDADDLVVLVYDPDHAEELVRLVRQHGVPGQLRACWDEATARAEIADVHVLVSGPFLTAALAEAHNLMWIQSLWAGIDTWTRESLRPGVQLTRMSDIDRPYMTEYVFAHLLSSTQDVAELRAAQEAGQWRPQPSGRLEGRSEWWDGARSVATSGTSPPGSVCPYAASAAARQAFLPVISPIYGQSEIGEFLAGLRILVVALPATPETCGLIDGPGMRHHTPRLRPHRARGRRRRRGPEPRGVPARWVAGPPSSTSIAASERR